MPEDQYGKAAAFFADFLATLARASLDAARKGARVVPWIAMLDWGDYTEIFGPFLSFDQVVRSLRKYGAEWIETTVKIKRIDPEFASMGFRFMPLEGDPGKLEPYEAPCSFTYSPSQDKVFSYNCQWSGQCNRSEGMRCDRIAELIGGG